jgi:3-dehydroquinate dehydratase II
MANQPRLLVVNGPNLNLLGVREPAIYGTATLADIQAMVDARAADLGWSVNFFQSNHEGALIDFLQKEGPGSLGVVLNPAGLTHTSVALADCIRAIDPVPVVEVHLSNLFAREEFRHRSVTAGAAVGIISGFGGRGYILAMEYLNALHE